MPTVDVPSTTCASWRRLYRFGKDGKALVGVPSEALQFSNECLVAYCSAEWCHHHAGALLDCSKHDLGSRTYISTCSLISVEHQSWHRIQQRVGAISFIRLLAVVLPVLRNIQRGLVVRHLGLWASRQASYPDYSVDSAKTEKFYYSVLTFKFACVLSVIQLLHFTQAQLNYGPTVSVLSVGPEYLLYCYFASPAIPDCFIFIHEQSFNNMIMANFDLWLTS